MQLCPMSHILDDICATIVTNGHKTEKTGREHMATRAMVAQHSTGNTLHVSRLASGLPEAVKQQITLRCGALDQGTTTQLGVLKSHYEREMGNSRNGSMNESINRVMLNAVIHALNCRAVGRVPQYV